MGSLSYLFRMGEKTMDTTGVARVQLREASRGVEEAAVLLENGGGWREIPKELRQISIRLCEIRDRLDLTPK